MHAIDLTVLSVHFRFTHISAFTLTNIAAEFVYLDGSDADHSCLFIEMLSILPQNIP